jgi:proline iminopeptidase
VDHFSAPEFALALARIEAHYFVNGGFLEHEEQLLDNVETIRRIPAVIVQGRYDVVCPIVTAWELAGRWPEADFRVVADAGHTAYEPGITHELVRATSEFLIADNRGSPRV